MKTNIKRICTSIFAFLLAVSMVFLCACQKKNISASNFDSELIEEVNKRDSKKNDEKDGRVKTNIFFDNTQGMHGFVCAGSGVKSEYSLFLKGLMDTVPSDKTSYFKLVNPLKEKKQHGFLRWEKSDKNKNFSDKMNVKDYKKKDFYTYTGNFNKGEGLTGPLDMLFFTGENRNIKAGELNIIITDLCEQELEHISLANEINKIVWRGKDQSVAIFCVESSFVGKSHIPSEGEADKDGNDNIADAPVDGKRPFYALIIGPTDSVIETVETVSEKLSNNGLREGKNFNCEIILPNRGLQYSSLKNVNSDNLRLFDNVNPNEKRHNDYVEYPETFNFNTSNLNYCLVSSDFDKLFDNNYDETYSVNFNYDDEVKDDKVPSANFAIANFYIPLSPAKNGEIALDKFKYVYDEDSIEILAYGEQTGSTEPESTSETTLDEDSLQWFALKKKDVIGNDDSIIKDITLTPCGKGETVKRANTDEFPKNKKGKSLTEENLYTVEEKDGILVVKVRLSNMKELDRKYDAISIKFKILAQAEEEETPEWVEKFNLPALADSGTDAGTKTPNLREFWNCLSGHSKDNEKVYKNHLDMTSSDVVINIKF